MATVMEKPFEQTLEAVATRTRAMNPVDRRQKLGLFAFGMEPSGQAYLSPLVAPGDVSIMPPRIELSNLALGQLCEKVGFPRRLLAKLPPQLNFLCINHLMQQAEEQQTLVRMVYGNHARALLGARYTPLDDIVLFEVAAEYLQGAVVRYESIGDLSTHLTLTWPAEKVSIQGAPGGTDTLERGIHIMNSEVGVRAITFTSVLWRPVCTNILPGIGFGEGDDFGYGNDGQLYRRVSRGHGRSGAHQAEEKSSWRFIHQGDLNRLKDFVRDAVADCKRRTEGLQARWQEGLQHALGDPIKAIEDMAQVGGLTQDQLHSVLNAFADSKPFFGSSVTGVANAFTLAAQAQEEAEARWQVQTLGMTALVSLN